MVSFYIFISTIASVPHYIMLLALVTLLIRNYKAILHNTFPFKPNLNLILITLIVFLSLINQSLTPTTTDILPSLFPYTIFMFASYFIAKYISIKDIKILVLLIALEVVIGMLEYLFKVNSFLFWEDFYMKYNTSNLIYFNKAFGLSVNSSILAIKITIAILLVEYFKLFENKSRFFIKIILFIGLYITFQRTSIIVIVFFYLIQFIKTMIATINPIKLQIRITKIITRTLFIVLILTLSGILIINTGKILNQFSKGKGKIELSGREKIWPQYITFIKNNIVFGNYSKKYFVEYRGEKEGAHAHNSFLEVLSTHGIIIFILFMLILIININKKNYLFMGSLVILSLFQYALFWGTSLVDIVFYIFVLQPISLNNDKNKLNTQKPTLSLS